MKFLVIDDESSIRSTLCDILALEGYDVEEAPNGAEALRLAEAQHFDLAICDIKMPQMDGFEVLAALQVISPNTAVVMMSGHATASTAALTVEKGAVAFISKPFDLEVLLQVVQKAGTA